MGSVETPDYQFRSRTDAATIAEARKHLKNEGWAVIPDVLSPEETQLVHERLWAAAKKFQEEGDETYMPILDPNASNIRVFYLMALDSIFRSLIQHPVAESFAASTLGDNYLISNFTANIARPGAKSMALHSDQSLVMPDPWTDDWALNVIWCLDDVHRDNGATLFIPGSDRWQRREDIPADARARLRPFEAKKGSVILMTGRVWHTSGANVTTDEDRALLFAYYTVPFLRQQVNWTAKMGEDLKSSLSPEMVERLGLNVSANMAQVSLLKYLDEQFPEEEAGRAKPTY